MVGRYLLTWKALLHNCVMECVSGQRYNTSMKVLKSVHCIPRGDFHVQLDGYFIRLKASGAVSPTRLLMLLR